MTMEKSTSANDGHGCLIPKWNKDIADVVRLFLRSSMTIVRRISYREYVHVPNPRTEWSAEVDIVRLVTLVPSPWHGPDRFFWVEWPWVDGRYVSNLNKIKVVSSQGPCTLTVLEVLESSRMTQQ